MDPAITIRIRCLCTRQEWAHQHGQSTGRHRPSAGTRLGAAHRHRLHRQELLYDPAGHGQLAPARHTHRAGDTRLRSTARTKSAGTGTAAILAGIERTGSGIRWHRQEDTWETGGCGRTRCLDACPTQAFAGPYHLDPNRCIAYWTIETQQPIPPVLRRHFGNRIFGCDICQEVCPYNRRLTRTPALAGLKANAARAGAASVRWLCSGHALLA
ncbi:MAG: hypothetical protein IPK16_30995 [Anaerolineales bacterium]|nr:hypothetical protein [Anaerolineales bacterium]